MRLGPLTHSMILCLIGVTHLSCGPTFGRVREVGVKIPVLPELDSQEALDPNDPSLTKYSSHGTERDPRLTQIISNTLDPKLKWKYSRSTQKRLDTPPTFDCEGYVRYVYRTFLGKEPWSNLRSAEILKNAEGFPEQIAASTRDFEWIKLAQARRGDLVVWRIADGWPTDHVAIYDGYVDFPKDGRVLKIAMVVSTSSSTSAKGGHAIQRFPLQYTMPATTKKKSGPHFVRVRY